MSDTRYPYTYACDHIRNIAGTDEFGSTKLSRSDASQIIKETADVMGLSHESLAYRLADRFLEREREIDTALSHTK